MAEKVLVVTPYMALGRLIRQSLEQSAYEVQVTESADDALDLVSQTAFFPLPFWMRMSAICLSLTLAKDWWRTTGIYAWSSSPLTTTQTARC